MLNSFAFHLQKISKGTELEEIGKSLPAVFKRQVRRGDAQLAEILAPLWSRVVGERVAEHSQPVEFWSGTLTIATACATWEAQLKALAGEILEAVNGFLGSAVVRELRVKYVQSLADEKDEVADAKAASDVAPEETSPGFELPGELDAETARTLERSFAKYFARGATRPD